MTEQQVAPPVQNANSVVAAESTVVENKKQGETEIADALREMQENAGQIAELAKEEENLVTEFFSSLFSILKSFGKTLEISVASLPENYKTRTNKAYLYLTGQLVLVYTNGEVEILNLIEQENHDVLIEIAAEIMTKLKTVINASKSKTEKRVKFLMSITKELEKVAKAFSEG
jgi:hypothetical protein